MSVQAMMRQFGRIYNSQRNLKVGQFAGQVYHAGEQADHVLSLVENSSYYGHMPTSQKVNEARTILSIARLAPSLVRIGTGDLFRDVTKEEGEKDKEGKIVRRFSFPKLKATLKHWVEILGNVMIVVARTLGLLRYVDRYKPFLGKHGPALGIAQGSLFLGTTCCETYLTVRGLMNKPDKGQWRQKVGACMQHISDFVTGIVGFLPQSPATAGVNLGGSVLWLAGEYFATTTPSPDEIAVAAAAA